MSFGFSTNDSYLYEEANQTGTPERLLLLAVLERAMLDYVGNDNKEANEAEAWIFGDSDAPDTDPFSFAWVCRELDLNPEAVSTMIEGMPKRGAKRIAPWYFPKEGSSAANANDTLERRKTMSLWS